MANEIAIFAAGCFWGVEESFRRMKGVLRTEVGYCGGKAEFPTYEEVCTGRTGHAESVRVEFDPKKVSYRELLAHFFLLHDPTEVDRQGPDIGTQYRSAIFCTSARQMKQAQAMAKEISEKARFGSPIATRIEKAGEFWLAEEYHQKYLMKCGKGACHFQD